MATKKQIKLIHVLKGALKMTRDEYECMLDGYGATSSKELSEVAAGHFLNQLTDMGVASGVWVNRNKPSMRKKYDDLAGRDPELATPRQLRMIEAMWADVSRATGEEKRAKALRSFLNRFKVSDIKFVDKRKASKIIATLENMVEAKAKAKRVA